MRSAAFTVAIGALLSIRRGGLPPSGGPPRRRPGPFGPIRGRASAPAVAANGSGLPPPRMGREVCVTGASAGASAARSDLRAPVTGGNARSPAGGTVVQVDPRLTCRAVLEQHGGAAPDVQASNLVAGIVPLGAVQLGESARQIPDAVEAPDAPAAVVEPRPGVVAEVVERAADAPVPLEDGRGAEERAANEARHQRAVREEALERRGRQGRDADSGLRPAAHEVSGSDPEPGVGTAQGGTQSRGSTQRGRTT